MQIPKSENWDNANFLFYKAVYGFMERLLRKVADQPGRRRQAEQRGRGTGHGGAGEGTGAGGCGTLNGDAHRTVPAGVDRRR